MLELCIFACTECLAAWVHAGPIVSLSLAGPCVMELRRGGDHRPLHLPPRSLLVLAGEARLAWHHYIPHRRADTLDGRRVPRASRRVSFTFRKVCLLSFACCLCALHSSHSHALCPALFAASQWPTGTSPDVSLSRPPDVLDKEYMELDHCPTGHYIGGRAWTAVWHT